MDLTNDRHAVILEWNFDSEMKMIRIIMELISTISKKKE